MGNRTKKTKTLRHQMSSMSAGRASTLKKCERLMRIDAGLRPRSVVIEDYHPTKGYRSYSTGM
jgi:hypothetical protein